MMIQVVVGAAVSTAVATAAAAPAGTWWWRSSAAATRRCRNWKNFLDVMVMGSSSRDVIRCVLSSTACITTTTTTRRNIHDVSIERRRRRRCSSIISSAPAAVSHRIIVDDQCSCLSNAHHATTRTSRSKRAITTSTTDTPTVKSLLSSVNRIDEVEQRQQQPRPPTPKPQTQQRQPQSVLPNDHHHQPTHDDDDSLLRKSTPPLSMERLQSILDTMCRDSSSRPSDWHRLLEAMADAATTSISSTEDNCCSSLLNTVSMDGLLQLRCCILEYLSSLSTSTATTTNETVDTKGNNNTQHPHQKERNMKQFHRLVRMALSRHVAAIKEQQSLSSSTTSNSETTTTTTTALPLIQFRSIHSPMDLPQDVLNRSSVHHVQNYTDLIQSMFDGPNNKHVFGLFDRRNDTAVAIVYVSLQSTIPSSLAQIFIPNSTSTLQRQINDSNNNDTSSTRTVATFYSIVANLQPVMTGIGLGEYLIHQTVLHLKQQQQQDVDANNKTNNNLTTFVTLSPMPDFRHWLMTSMLQPPSLSPDSHSQQLHHRDHDAFWKRPNVEDQVRCLCNAWNCSERQVLSTLLQKMTAARESLLLRSSSVVETGIAAWQRGYGSDNVHRLVLDDENGTIETSARQLLTSIATYYIMDVKMKKSNDDSDMARLGGSCSEPQQQKKPYDRVARFHLSNGASMYRVNLFADLSDTGWTNSFGVMVNYLYPRDGAA